MRALLAVLAAMVVTLPLVYLLLAALLATPGGAALPVWLGLCLGLLVLIAAVWLSAGHWISGGRGLRRLAALAWALGAALALLAWTGLRGCWPDC